MAFGFEILHGRGGAAGHCRELGEKKEIHIRGLAPGKQCILYALLDDGAEKLDEQTADGNGQAMLTGNGGFPILVASDGRVLLWQGREENYLRASEWMKREQAKAGEAQQAASSEPISEQEEQPVTEQEDTARILARDLEEIQLPPESEPSYALRSPGTGDPVDTLPN
ncbi:MAG: hypothetical protein IKH30_12300 [Clostridia bacterium]|nr:hypothetical protein [Clostridia bacterium]